MAPFPWSYLMTARMMLPADMQETNERRFLRKHLDGYLRTTILADTDMGAMIEQGVAMLKHWLTGSYYLSKNKRLAQLKGLDLEALVIKIFVGTIYYQRPETFVSVTAQMAGYLGFDDKVDSITTVAELVAILCRTGAYRLTKESIDSTVMVQSAMTMPSAIQAAIERSRYPLPMVCEPKFITNNFESPYLTFNECQILGKGNNHAHDICLDVLNTQNQIPLSLATDFLSTVEEEPSYAFETAQQAQEWARFKWESYDTYTLLVKQGNRFWLTHKVDKRGRLYAVGYHVTTQGSPFKKAIVEFANKEIVQGVPK